MRSIQVQALRADKEFRRYEDFPQEVYRNDPCWAPRPPGQLFRLISGRAARCQTLELQPFWAECDGRIVATATAVIDQEYNRRWREKLGHLTSFEALPDSGRAARQLLEAAAEWCHARDCTAIRASYLGGWQLPFTIDGYDVPASAFHGYNPPYYHSYLKNSDFQTEKGMVEYQLPLTPELAESHRRIVAAAEGKSVRFRCWDADRLEQEAALYGRVMNESFSQHWGMMAFPDEHFKGLAAKRAVVPEFQVFAEAGGQLVGVVSSPPNVNQALLAARRGGFGVDSPEYVQAWEKIDHGILLTIGVNKEFRGRGIAAALAAKSYLAMYERGYKLASYTPVLDDNWASRRTAEKVGGRVVRNYVIYRVDL